MTDKEADQPPVPPSSAPPSKVAVQFKKIRDANDRYKDLLKMAKERIQQQDDEMKRLKAASEEQKQKMEAEERDAANMISMDDTEHVGDVAEHSCSIVRVCQRICVDLLSHETNLKGGTKEYWALVEFETYNPDQPEHIPAKRVKKWKRFDSESALQDFVRRDTGEPITLPPPSLTPQQSAQIEEEAERNVSRITEEFRRFRVKAEMARKQADQQIRDLQNSKVENAKRRIEGNRPDNVGSAKLAGLAQNAEVEDLKSALANQEAQWKRAYDMLLAQNEVLQSSGSEALLASQWRNRFETALKEKAELENKLRLIKQKAGSEDESKSEEKYRDLKESFRLYRKKAKEIFEAQQNGETGLMQLTDPSSSASSPPAGAEGKLDYLKNLMVNYLTSDAEVRDHMEIAIGTVLQFTPNDVAKIEKKKKDDEYWNLF